MNESKYDKLTSENVYSTLKEFFPKRNDFYSSDYSEEVEELIFFGIRSLSDLRSLLEKHSKEVLEIDASPMDEWHQKFYIRESPGEPIRQRIEEGYWFAFPALLRIALELEFGEEYIEYANKRDGV